MSLKNRLILQREKIFERFSKPSEKVYLPFQIKRSEQIFICLPERKNGIANRELTNDYQILFNGCTIQFCASSDMASEILNSANCLYYEKDSFPVLRRLPDLLKNDMNAKSYRVAIDLNVDFSLSAAVICKMTKAPVRISFKKPNAQVFFNILIAPQENQQSYMESLLFLKTQLRSWFALKNSDSLKK